MRRSSRSPTVPCHAHENAFASFTNPPPYLHRQCQTVAAVITRQRPDPDFKICNCRTAARCPKRLEGTTIYLNSNHLFNSLTSLAAAEDGGGERPRRREFPANEDARDLWLMDERRIQMNQLAHLAVHPGPRLRAPPAPLGGTYGSGTKGRIRNGREERRRAGLMAQGRKTH